MMKGFKLVVSALVGASAAVVVSTSPIMAREPHHPAAARAATASSDSADAVNVLTRFHAALAIGDSLTALSLLAADVTILESGALETLADYRSHHLAADIDFAKAVPSKRT